MDTAAIACAGTVARQTAACRLRWRHCIGRRLAPSVPFTQAHKGFPSRLDVCDNTGRPSCLALPPHLGRMS